MKLFETKHYFNYPWDQVTAANWQKYPNELSTHVVSVDILAREIDVENKTLRTERLIGCKQAIPNWLSFIVGGQKLSYVREVSEVDLVNNTLVMKSHNLTMNHILLVNETVIYRPDPELKTRTLFQQSAEITAYATISRICDKLEEWSVERFGQNAKTGKLAFEGVLDTLSRKWEESGVFVSDVLKDINNEVSEKTNDVVNEVSKLGIFKFNKNVTQSPVQQTEVN
ncbi:PRELI-like family-domain-containing protein [Scheffersomyces amazonensis]|uniref:PRELI-like family-domain-containing protein n=1 Tax=Scheffersomyces amazonensis TaxID=1078765 RepID=UPI00315CFF7F